MGTIFGKRSNNSVGIGQQSNSSGSTKIDTTSVPQVPLSSNPFLTSDEGLQYFLNAQRPEILTREERSNAAQEELKPWLATLLERPSGLRAELLLTVCKMREVFAALHYKEQKPFHEHGNRANELITQMIDHQEFDYDIEILANLYRKIPECFGSNQRFEKLVDATIQKHRQPSSTSKMLLADLSGNQAIDTFFKVGYRRPVHFQAIVKAYSALGNPPGSHKLTRILAQEKVAADRDCQTLEAACHKDFLPIYRLCMPKFENQENNQQINIKLLMNDLATQDPSLKGDVFYSLVQLRLIMNSLEICKNQPSMGYELVLGGNFATLTSTITNCFQTFCKKKLVFQPGEALELLKLLSAREIKLFTCNDRIGGVFWKSLGSSLPQHNLEVRQIVNQSSALEEKKKETILKAAGFDSGDEDIEAFKAKIESSLLEEVSKSSNTNTQPPGYQAGQKQGLIQRFSGVFGKKNSNQPYQLTPNYLNAPAWRTAVISSLYMNIDVDVQIQQIEALAERYQQEISRELAEENITNPDDFQTICESFSGEKYLRYTRTLGNLNITQGIIGLNEIITALSPHERENLSRLHFAMQPLQASGKPSNAWLKRVENAIDPSNEAILETLLSKASNIHLVDSDGTVSFTYAASCLSNFMIPTLEEIANTGFENIAGQGMSNQRLGNAALFAIARISGSEAAKSLTRISQRCSFPSARQQASDYLAEISIANADDPLQAEEIKFQDWQLWPEDRREALKLGAALYSFKAPDRVVLSWELPDGAPSKLPNKEMKDADSLGIRQAKKLVTQIENHLREQILWMQCLFLQTNNLPHKEWEERYLKHGTRGGISSRLIWTAVNDEKGERINFIPEDAGFVDVAGNKVMIEGMDIRLWHPVDDEENVALSWQNYLVEKNIFQSFTQAFRLRVTREKFKPALEMIIGQHQKESRYYRELPFDKFGKAIGWNVKKSISKSGKGNAFWYEPATRLYIELIHVSTLIKQQNYPNWDGRKIDSINIYRGELGAIPTASGLKKKTELDPSELDDRTLSEIVFHSYQLASHQYETNPPVEGDLRFSTRPFIAPSTRIWKPLAEEKVKILNAFATDMVAQGATKNWKGKSEGKVRIDVKEQHIIVRGANDSYLVCPHKHTICNEASDHDYEYRLSDSTIASANSVPVGIDSDVRHITAVIEMLTKDDRMGNNCLRPRSRQNR